MRTLITVEELAARTTYSEHTLLRGHVARNMIEGVHYVRPFGGKRKLFVWEAIEEEMFNPPVREKALSDLSIPMANGGTCHG